MFRKARAQGASVGYVHAYAGERDPLETDLGGAKGAIVDAALGTTDAIEWSAAGRAGFFPLYALWNNGLKVTAVGGEDSISNLHMSKLVGSHRTYVFTGGRGLDMHAWLDGMRAGRAFVTNGPLVELSVNGAVPGETVTMPAGGGDLDVQVQVRSIVPLQKVTLLFNGQPVEDIPLSADRRTRRFPQDAAGGEERMVSRSCRRDAAPIDFRSIPVIAQGFTNPVWVIVGDQPIRDRASADTPCDGSTNFRSSPMRGPDGARRRKRITSTGSSKRHERCTADWRPKQVRALQFLVRDNLTETGRIV